MTSLSAWQKYQTPCPFPFKAVASSLVCLARDVRFFNYESRVASGFEVSIWIFWEKRRSTNSAKPGRSNWLMPLCKWTLAKSAPLRFQFCNMYTITSSSTLHPFLPPITNKKKYQPLTSAPLSPLHLFLTNSWFFLVFFSLFLYFQYCAKKFYLPTALEGKNYAYCTCGFVKQAA